MERHAYEPCDHEGRHGYTLRGEPEYDMCERCRRGPEAHIPVVIVEAAERFFDSYHVALDTLASR